MTKIELNFEERGVYRNHDVILSRLPSPRKVVYKCWLWGRFWGIYRPNLQKREYDFWNNFLWPFHLANKKVSDSISLKRVYHLDNCCRACRETPNGKLYSTESSLNKISARFKVWKMSEWSHLLDLFTFPSPVSCWLLPYCFHIAADLSFSHASEWTPWINLWTWNVFEFSSDFSQVSWYLPPCYVIYSTAVEEIGGNTLPWPWMHIVILSTYVSI